ncbi:MAG TPA: hypothetical protein VK559_07180 [Ferruginibacter sp.]|nr:hypothetical protein [Ferruginibacter sp.]
MNTLLKDKPEFSERIENNYLAIQDIKDIVGDDINIEELIEKISEHVNQNYIFKGDLPVKLRNAMNDHFEITKVTEAVLS